MESNLYSENHAGLAPEATARRGLAGVSFIEAAIVVAATFVVWKNRLRIQSYLEENGIEVPALLSQAKTFFMPKTNFTPASRSVANRGAR